MTTCILSTKVFLLSAGAVGLAMAIKSTVQLICSDVVLSWLKPPYVYILVNGIIITIAASSRFHWIHSDRPHVQSHDHSSNVGTPPPRTDLPSFPVAAAAEETPAVSAGYETESEEIGVELKPVPVNGPKVLNVEEETVTEGADGVFNSRLKYNTPSPEKPFPVAQYERLVPAVMEKPLISSRSGHRLRTSRATKHDTLDSIWKKITEGSSRATPEAPPEEVRKKLAARPFPVQDHHLSKSKVAKERWSNRNGMLGLRIGKEPSLSSDELNCRVEAFIKFNGERRLEREELMNK
ncbi:hypothetical protein OROHE_010380 [Orobanche hederae]